MNTKDVPAATNYLRDYTEDDCRLLFRAKSTFEKEIKSEKFYIKMLHGIFLDQVLLKTEVLCTPSSI